VSASTVLFYIGDRSKEVVANLLGDDYAGWLMSDGYGVYREHVCWFARYFTACFPDCLTAGRSGFGALAHR